MTAIDISYWQGHPDFAQVKGAGVELVIMKCGGGEPGRMYTDSVYVTNRTAARAHGLPVGSYFFNGPVDPTAAADYQWSVIDWQHGDVVAIDVENSSGVTRWTPAQVLAWAQRMLAHGVPASSILVYMSSSVTSLNWAAVKALGVGLWVAQYGTNNGTPQGTPNTGGWSWVLWQYTSVATFPGISGSVDASQITAGWTPVGPPPSSKEESMTTVCKITANSPTHGLSGIWFNYNDTRAYVYSAAEIGDGTAAHGGSAATVDAPNFNRAFGGAPVDVGQSDNAIIILQHLGFDVGEFLDLTQNGGGEMFRPTPAATLTDAQITEIASKIVVPPVDLTPALAAIAALDTQADDYQAQLKAALAAVPGAVVKAEGAALANG